MTKIKTLPPFILAGCFFFSHAYATETFNTSLTISPPNTEVLIGDAAGTSLYGSSQKISLEGNVTSSQVATADTYVITLENTKNSEIKLANDEKSHGLALMGETNSSRPYIKTIGAVINQMIWSTDQAGTADPIEFISASGSCSIGENKKSILFGALSGNCEIHMTGQQLAKLDGQGYGNYATTTQDNVYGHFSQTITYTVSHS